MGFLQNGEFGISLFNNYRTLSIQKSDFDQGALIELSYVARNTKITIGTGYGGDQAGFNNNREGELILQDDRYIFFTATVMSNNIMGEGQNHFPVDHLGTLQGVQQGANE